jgi:uncharacterized protein involved in exopolysaccharide biosynthesis
VTILAFILGALVGAFVTAILYTLHDDWEDSHR